MARRVKPKPEPEPEPGSLWDVGAIAEAAMTWACDRKDVSGIAVFLSDANATKRPALLVRFYRRGETLSRWFEPDVTPPFARRVLTEACRSADLSSTPQREGDDE